MTGPDYEPPPQDGDSQDDGDSLPPPDLDEPEPEEPGETD